MDVCKAQQGGKDEACDNGNDKDNGKPVHNRSTHLFCFDGFRLPSYIIWHVSAAFVQAYSANRIIRTRSLHTKQIVSN